MKYGTLFLRVNLIIVGLLISNNTFAQTPDFLVQHIQDDISNTGGFNSSFTAVSSLNSAFALANNNRKTHAGNNGITTNLEGDDLAGARVLTNTNTLSYYREPASVNNPMRFNSSIWEYIGPAGGANEFIVRGRYAVVLNGTTNSITQTLSGIGNANDCIPFITGIMNNATTDGAISGTAIAYLENATTLRVQKGSTSNNVTVYVTVVEFTGSNWTVLHGDSGIASSNTGNITLRNGSDGTGTATGVASWNEAIIFTHHRGDSTTSVTTGAIADNWPLMKPGGTTQTVAWSFNANHISDPINSNRHFVHVLHNSNLAVTRISNSSALVNENTFDISSAGLGNINEALIIGTSISSGTGTGYAKGWRNYYFNTTTQAAHWCHRDGNGMSHEIQIVNLAGLTSVSYCTSNGNSTSDEYIGRVQLNTLDNSSGTGTTSIGYSDFTSLVAATNLDTNSNYTITITPTWTGTAFDEGHAVWIDYNQDGDFDDAGEQVATIAPTTITPVSSSFTVPVTATPGNTRMRVSMKYNSTPTACEIFDFGEVEDYLVTIVAVASPEMDVLGNTISITNGDTAPSIADNTDFGNTDITVGSVVNTFTIENTGTATLNLTGGSPYITISGANAADFTVTAIPAATIAVSSSTTFNITFNPTTTGLKTATLSIANTDSDENPYSFSIQGKGTTTVQEIDVSGSGVSIASGDTTPALIDNTNFGNVVTAGGSRSNVFVIENEGTISNLLLTGASPYVTITGADAADFSIISIPSNNIAASSTTSFVIAFDPSSDGIKNATVTIANDDPNESSYTFSIRGSGITPPPCGVTVLHTADFETGTDGWTIGGTDAQRQFNSARSYSNDYSLEIRHNDSSGNNSSVLSPLLNFGGYDKVDFKFFFTSHNVEDNEEFFIEYSDDGGTTWYVAATYHCGDTSTSAKDGDFLFGDTIVFYSKTATIFDTDYAFPSGLVSQFRVRSNSNEINDLIYIDHITITATTYCTPITAPGGVTANLDLWLKADTVDGSNIGSDGSAITQWYDNGKGNHAETTITAQAPTYRNNTTDNFNFNPVINFENNNSTAPGDMTYLLTDRDVLKGTGGFNSNDIFVVVIPDVTVTTSMVPMDTFTGAAPNLSPQSYTEDVTGFGYGNYTVRMSNELLSYCIGTSVNYGSADTSSTTDLNSISILNFRHNTTDTAQEIAFNGTRVDDIEANASFFTTVNNSRYFIGRSQYWGGSFNGRIAEIITYSSTNGDTSDTDLRNRIQSYLAIKYGITLDPDTDGTTKTYVNSDGIVIWDQLANVGYNHDIAGIGRDDMSELNQKQSSSINDGADGTGPTEGILTIGLSDIYDTNSDNITSNPTAFDDKEFLVWGNNGADLNLAAATVYVDMSSGISGLSTAVNFTAMQRVWKVVETGGDVPSCKIRIPQNAIRNITPPGNYYMFISDTSVFDPTADYRIMTPDGSGNLETNYDFNGVKYITFGYAPQIIVERSIYFNGTADYVDMDNHFDLDPVNFTISAWIKRDTGTTDASIISKRDAAFTEGYDFRINGSGNLQFVLNGGASSLTSTVAIPENKWHHVALIYNAGNATLYIDGVADTSASSIPAPVATAQSFLLAAADGYDPDTTDFFAGNIDEVRIWNTALSVNQLRYIMNQEIMDDATNTLQYGDVIPTTITKNEISSIPWTDLAGYYPMNVYSYTNTNDMSGNNIQGALRNLNTVDYQTAPLPYRTQAAGAWDASATWLNNTVLDLPNAFSIVDGTTPIDWNIVEINHNTYLRATATTERSRNCSVQALIINSGDLQVNGNTAANEGIGLTVTHYLKLDGTIDLEGESQLIQTNNSDFDAASTGTLERDQQGVGNTYIYNYWCSPVSPTSNTNYIVPSVFNNVGFSSSGYNGSASPVTNADYWIWKYANLSNNNYYNWQHVRGNSTLMVGQGFTMKGPGVATMEQNYEFLGQPNNGDFSLPITVNNDYLIGNPYPSAIDADAFIRDNISTADGGTNSVNVINGALYFWDHFAINSHTLAEYQGGYAVYTLMGGTVAISSDTRINATNVPGTKLPERYIPVGQGFFVSAVNNGTIAGLTQPIVGGNILLKNSQRVFQKEAVTGSNTGSVFLKYRTGKNAVANTTKQSSIDERSKIRLMLDSPNGYHRELLVGADIHASNNFDLGYDAILIETNTEDMYWNLNNTPLLIQAVGNFDVDQKLPLSLKIAKQGIAAIRVSERINIPENKTIYLHDKTLGLYHDLKTGKYNVTVFPGTYNDRFEITFSNGNTTTLNTNDINHEYLQIIYANDTDNLIINNPRNKTITNINVVNLLGQSVFQFSDRYTNSVITYHMEHLATGAYVVKVTLDNGQIYTYKVFVD